jgi:hypothetical protein
MKRTFWIALATGTMISGAAAIGIEAPSAPLAQPLTHAQRASALEAARQAQRGRIEARYQAERAQCDSLGGARRDRCFIDAHARRGLLMMETAAPYQS